MVGFAALSGLSTVALAILLRPRRPLASEAGAAPRPSPAPRELAKSVDAVPRGNPAPREIVPSAGAAPSSQPAAHDQSNDAAVTAEFDRGIVAGLDGTLHGTLESYDFLRSWTLARPAEVVQSLKRYQASYSDWLDARAAAGRLSQKQAQDAKAILLGLDTANKIEGGVVMALDITNKVLDAAGDAVAAIPAIGSVVKGVYQIVQMFVQAAAQAKDEGHDLYGTYITLGGHPLFSGFRDGNFFFQDLPVWAFTVPMWITEFTIAGGSQAWQPMIQGFKLLCMGQPLGYPLTIAPVTIENDGSFSYRFNLVRPGDLGDEAIARQEVRGVTVWNPADITATGPRGFDPLDPWSWKQPGMKLSRLDYTGPGSPVSPLASRTGGL